MVSFLGLTPGFKSLAPEDLHAFRVMRDSKSELFVDESPGSAVTPAIVHKPGHEELHY